MRRFTAKTSGRLVARKWHAGVGVLWLLAFIIGVIEGVDLIYLLLLGLLAITYLVAGFSVLDFEIEVPECTFCGKRIWYRDNKEKR